MSKDNDKNKVLEILKQKQHESALKTKKEEIHNDTGDTKEIPLFEVPKENDKIEFDDVAEIAELLAGIAEPDHKIIREATEHFSQDESVKKTEDDEIEQPQKIRQTGKEIASGVRMFDNYVSVPQTSIQESIE